MSRPYPSKLTMLVQAALLAAVVGLLLAVSVFRLPDHAYSNRAVSSSVSSGPQNLYLLTESEISVYSNVDALAQQKFTRVESYAAPQSGAARWTDYLRAFFVDEDRRIYYSGSGEGSIHRMDDIHGKNKRSVSGENSGTFHVRRDRVYYTTLLGQGQAIVSLPVTGDELEIYPLPSRETSRIVLLFVDEAGRIYFNENHQIVRMDNLRGDNLVRYGEQGDGKGQFLLPRSLAVDRQGRLYIADEGNARVVRIDDMQGTNWTALRAYGKNRMRGVRQVGLDRENRLCIFANSEYEGCRILRVDDMTGKGWITLLDHLPLETLQFYVR